ncbi:MAG: hypothetical protein Q9227_000849 [Pyrenula ochraceoflavens]
MSIIRTAILDCDSLVTSVRAKYGDYGGVVTAFLEAGAKRLGLPENLFEISSWKVTEESFKYPDLDTIETLIITGSRSSAYDDAIHQMHHDILYSLPVGVASLGSSSVCEVQGMFRPRKLLTLQGHPEFDGEIMVSLLEATDELGFDDKTLWQDAMARSREPHHGELVASVILRFIRGDFDSLDAEIQ